MANLGIGQGFDPYDDKLPSASPEVQIGDVQRDGAVTVNAGNRSGTKTVDVGDLLNHLGYVIPVVAVASGMILFGERMSPPEMAGSIMVIVGVVLATQYDLVKSKFLSRQTS